MHEVSGLRVVEAGRGEVVGDSPDRRVEILCDHADVHATWSRFGPHRDGADLHIHREHTDFFFVLEGELTVRLGPHGAPRTVRPGSMVRVPPLVVHGFANTSEDDVLFLNFHVPGKGFADFMRGLREPGDGTYDQFEPPADGGRAAGDASVGEPSAPFAVEHVDPESELGLPAAGLWALYVIDGELAVSDGSRTQITERGAWVQADPGEARDVRARGSGKALVLKL